MKILFFGSARFGATSLHRAEAFRRLHHDVTHIDLESPLENHLSNNLGRFHYHTGYRFLQPAVSKYLSRSNINNSKFDVCWVDSGELLGEASIRHLKHICNKIVLFNHDDPTGPRDWRRFYSLRKAIPKYDLCLVVRPFNVAEFISIGASRAIHVYRTYDEVSHAPMTASESIESSYLSDVSFVGANYKNEGRDRFIASLIKAGFRVAIWGDRWDTSEHWQTLRSSYRGGNLSGRNYVKAIAGSKLCLGFLSSRNRDEHTTRSLEIPYAGGILFGKRTVEHETLYVDQQEAIFWNDVDECIELCKSHIDDVDRLKRIRMNGMNRVRQNKCGNEDLIKLALRSL